MIEDSYLDALITVVETLREYIASEAPDAMFRAGCTFACNNIIKTIKEKQQWDKKA